MEDPPRDWFISAMGVSKPQYHMTVLALTKPFRRKITDVVSKVANAI